MRNLAIKIYPRVNSTDNFYEFSSLNTLNTLSLPLDLQGNGNLDVSSIYQFISLDLNYSVQSSSITSTLVLSMNESKTIKNALRSGQYIEVRDNGKTIFQGVLLSCSYNLLSVENENQGGMYVIITLAPSIYQFTITPFVLDANQATQISKALNTSIPALFASGIAQIVNTQDFINYMVTNTDLNTFFNKTIVGLDLPTNVFLMADAGISRDSVFRSSIDYTNTVFYQKEDGTILTRLLSVNTFPCPFSIDITNNTNFENYASVLQYTENDNIASTPSVINNYSILSSNLSIGANVNQLLTNYYPNPLYFNRIQQLVKTGWFTGIISHTPINTNIVTNATTASIFNKYLTYNNNPYILSSTPSGAINDEISAYQNLLTAKEMAQALTGYISLECTISLDDPNINQDNLQFILGTIINVPNSELGAGIIATYNRNYSNKGAFATLNICPLGSITGVWK